VFPASHLPGWLAGVNQWLPFGSMAAITRSALVAGYAGGAPRGYAVVAAWAAGSALVVAWAQGRRG
jgi:ABC-2 type transport system permease protein